MNIAIVGAGIVGIATAYELAADGHTVTVFERRSAAAEESSFANAGVVAPGCVTPWVQPAMTAKMLHLLLSRHAPVRLALPLSTHELGWIWRWWRSRADDGYARRRAQMHRLALYSSARLHALTAALELDYERSDGYLVLLRDESDAALAVAGLQVLRDAGVAYRQVDATTARGIEPALHPDTPLHSAIHLPDDEVGNCRQFALLLKTAAQRLGVQFVFDTAVTRIGASPASVTLAGDGQPWYFDAVVVSAGVASAALLRPLGVRVPLAAVYGYSISAAVREAHHAPRSGVMDERFQVAITRLGQRVRVAGSAEIGGDPHRKRPQAMATLHKVLNDWFPGATQRGAALQEWKGARPMLPDGPPMVGASGAPGVWLNLGHGASGWALACGSARALADLVAGRTPDVDLSDLGVPDR